jgi:hypothetical protein
MAKPQRSGTAPADAESPFARFTRVVRGLMAVPKKELDEKIAAEKRRRARAKS